MLAAVRPDSWNLPLLLHVLGAMVLVGTLAVVAVTLVASTRDGSQAAAGRIGFRTLLLGALPSYLVMRISAEWIADKEDVPDDVDWVGIGYIVADGGLLLLLIATVTAGIASRRAGASRAAGVLALVMVVANLVALWAMTAKPG